MIVTEIYINKEETNTYPLHEAVGSGYSSLRLFADKPIQYAIETYNKALEENPEENLDINALVIEEETGLEFLEECDLIVNVNDEVLVPFKGYFIYDNSILFKDKLEVGSIIKITDKVKKTKIITKNSYNRNALLHNFTSDQKLKFNNEYTFSLNIDNKAFETNFESQYDPYYSNINLIRANMGSCIAKVKDSQIAKLIFLQSKDVFLNITNNDKLDDLTDIEKNKYLQNIVRLKTDIELCWLLYYAASGKYGTIDKQIGTIEIEKNIKLPYIETMLKRFQGDLDELQNQLNGTPVVYMTKAGNTTYPVSERGVF